MGLNWANENKFNNLYLKNIKINIWNDKNNIMR